MQVWVLLDICRLQYWYCTNLSLTWMRYSMAVWLFKLSSCCCIEESEASWLVVWVAAVTAASWLTTLDSCSVTAEARCSWSEGGNTVVVAVVVRLGCVISTFVICIIFKACIVFWVWVNKPFWENNSSRPGKKAMQSKITLQENMTLIESQKN